MRTAAALAALATASCGGCVAPVIGHVDALLSTTGVFPSAAAQLAFDGGYANFQGTFRQSVQGQGADPSQIDTVKMKSFQVTVTQPGPDDPSYRGLSFLTAMRVKFQADGLPDVVVAHRESFAPTAGQPPPTQYAFDVDASTELKPYLTAPVITVVMESEGTAPPVSTTARVDMVLDVGAVMVNTGAAAQPGP